MVGREHTLGKDKYHTNRAEYATYSTQRIVSFQTTRTWRITQTQRHVFQKEKKNKEEGILYVK